MSKIKRVFNISGLLIIGGIISHFLVTPYLDGDYDDEIYSFKSFINGEKPDQNQVQEIIYNRMDKSLQRSFFKEFHDEYGEDAIVEYEKYIRNSNLNNERSLLDFFTTEAINNRTNQMNPNNSSYGSSRNSGVANLGLSRSSINNRSNQMNSNNSSYGSSRNSGGGNQGLSRSSINNRSNQLNSNNSSYGSSRNSGGGNQGLSRSGINNRSNQINPNNSAYKGGKRK